MERRDLEQISRPSFFLLLSFFVPALIPAIVQLKLQFSIYYVQTS